MVQIELVPDLSHCVETVAKKEYENLAKDYLITARDDAESKEKMELLRTFLETADFRGLRKESESYILKGQSVKFILYRQDGEVRYRLIVS
jgi:hypothetical protein